MQIAYHRSSYPRQPGKVHTKSISVSYRRRNRAAARNVSSIDTLLRASIIGLTVTKTGRPVPGRYIVVSMRAPHHFQGQALGSGIADGPNTPCAPRQSHALVCFPDDVEGQPNRKPWKQNAHTASPPVYRMLVACLATTLASDHVKNPANMSLMCRASPPPSASTEFEL